MFNEPGIFVAFEESSKRIVVNAAKFGWDLPALQERKLFFLDAHPDPDLVLSGTFDLAGLLAGLGAKADEMKAQRIVFDAIDVVVTLLNDPLAQRREIQRLHNWLLARELTALVTCKRNLDGTIQPPLDFMQFMVDCDIILRHDVVQGISQRNMRVVKYRGSSFEENEAPFAIGRAGLDVARRWLSDRAAVEAPKPRISSGIERLDAVLGGGYYAESSILITGKPGTAKTTLCGAFVEAACRRGERALYVSFDTDASEMISNLASVNIKLVEFARQGLLRMATARSVAASAEIHLMNIKNLAHEHQAVCVVVDPVSALCKSGNALTSHSVSERLVDWAKSEGITLICTSMLDATTPESEVTPLQISTLADTWIHLGYLIHAGERNRSLSVVKSRGTWHSNQVRELLLSTTGVTLADAYTAGGEVLMGTLRWEKERAEEAARSDREVATKQRQAKLELDEFELEIRLKSTLREIEAKRAELVSLARTVTAGEQESQLERLHLGELRGADAPRSKFQ